ncbi:MAG: bifunctional proline dehydrogenase/L-glutamate gamma-semialdehyde dehydrogenase [Actinobacteria bacterium]|nr:bifunctional proline dehydrogenase/L-glutamate gamma-semialdehyde dehydrogenase [Actinomycetota bacterium]
MSGDASDDAGRLTEDAVALVAHWINLAGADETRAERALGDRLAGLIADPDGVAFTMRFVDRVARHRDDRAAARELAHLVAEGGLPGFLGPLDRMALHIGARLAPLLPGLVMPLARRRMRSMVGHLVVDAEPGQRRAHLAERRSEGYDLNVNLLGEAVLGDGEAGRRFEQTLRLIDDPGVDYVSIKVSAIASQINLWAFDHTTERIKDRLRVLYQRAMASSPPTFVNLDMEEYRDLELTIRAFTELLDEPDLVDLEAGIVLQAYLPDSFDALRRLTEWAGRRRAAGGAGIKVRLVKGANLAMERVEAEVHGWTQAPYATKAEVDANYKRCVDWVLRPDHAGAVRIGLASHNLFDVAWTHLLAEQRGVAGRVEFEMLQGMATAQARSVRDATGGMLLYTPIVGRADFDVAISYLFRRLEENAAPENFLCHLFTLQPGTPEFVEQADRFSEAVTMRWAVGSKPRRDADPVEVAEIGFANQPDTDPAMAAARTRLASLSGREVLSTQTPAVTTVTGIESAVAGVRAAQTAWSARPASDRRQVLRRVADELMARHDDLLVTMAHEAGKTLPEAVPEISEAVDFARWYAERCTELEQITAAEFTPLGVVAVVPPWNFPVAIPCGGVVAALAAGNGVVFKPASRTRRCAEIIAEACWASGVPTDLLRFVHTAVPDVKQRLITAADGVVLTGGVETADLFRSWRPDLPLFGETSGKNALIVTPSADLDLAAADLVKSAFGHQGQKCSAASLGILVGSVVHDERFLRQVVDAAASLVVGPATDPATTFGPLIGPATGKLADALTTLAPGERWLLEPRRLDTEGRCWTPGIKAGVTPGSDFHHTECFGPVLGLMAAPDLDAAIELQNAVDYGLTGGIHTLDPAQVDRWLELVAVGNAYVNRPITGAIVRRQPFGGWKRSSIGPGAKAGGYDYLLQLGTWRPNGAAPDLAGHLSDDDRWWAEHYGIEHDPSGLVSEANVLRYLPHPDVIIRIGDGATEAEVVRVLAAARRCGVEPRVSRLADEDDPAFAASLSDHRFGRIRAVGTVGDQVRRAAIDDEVDLIDEAVTASGRLELRWYLREQSVSRTLHRFGNLVGADQG